MLSLSIQTARGECLISWTDVQKLIEVSSHQTCNFCDPHITTDFEANKQKFISMCQREWLYRETIGVFNNLPKDARVADIGCGIAVIDLILSFYLPNSRFTLMDADELQLDKLYSNYSDYAEEYPLYNMWSPLMDGLQTTGITADRFTMVAPHQNLPTDLDMIMSLYSWGYHYPKHTHWKKVKESLKRGGYLMMDVRIMPNDNTIEEISEELKSHPQKIPLLHLPLITNPIVVEQGNVMGYTCVWQNNSYN